MSGECICPHQDAREPDHDFDCPAFPRFDRFRAQELLMQARPIFRDRTTGACPTAVIDGLVEQLRAAIGVIDRVPTDVLAQVLMRRV